MLQEFSNVAFLGSDDLERSREFYEGVLGLNYQGRDQFALIFELQGVLLRINHLSGYVPREHTVFGWVVTDIDSIVKQLFEKGVEMERYEFFTHDDLGIVEFEGIKLAYFKDPDGNVLSLTQYPTSHISQS